MGQEIKVYRDALLTEGFRIWVEKAGETQLKTCVTNRRCHCGANPSHRFLGTMGECPNWTENTREKRYGIGLTGGSVAYSAAQSELEMYLDSIEEHTGRVIPGYKVEKKLVDRLFKNVEDNWQGGRATGRATEEQDVNQRKLLRLVSAQFVTRLTADERTYANDERGSPYLNACGWTVEVSRNETSYWLQIPQRSS